LPSISGGSAKPPWLRLYKLFGGELDGLLRNFKRQIWPA
jgi:hypothetical protein